jgi:hypothetical protein
MEMKGTLGSATTTTTQAARPKKEAGFALILALLSILLLTFLGLTLATTTSTELLIATNYRWGQQALYNAQAGIEAGKYILQKQPNWQSIVPAPRAASWNPGAAVAAPAGPPWTGVDSSSIPARNYENAACDTMTGSGFGAVLFDGTTAYQNVSAVYGQSFDGAFTLWVRRDVRTLPSNNAYGAGGNKGQLQDDQTSPPQVVILTAEGTAPYSAGLLSSGQAVSNRAVQYLQVTLSLAPSVSTSVCSKSTGQVGAGASGAGFNPCSKVSSQAVAGLKGSGTNTETTNQ